MSTIIKNFANTRGNWQDVSYLSRNARRIVFVPKYGSDQTENVFATEAAVTGAAVLLLCNDHDLKDRLFPLPSLENVENIRAESTFFEWNSGQKSFIKDGAKHFKAFIKVEDGGPALVKALQDFRAGKFGCYIIDKDGNWLYNLDDAGTIVKPFPIDGGTFDVMWVEPTDEAVGMIQIDFDFADDMNDGNHRYIQFANMDFDGRIYDDLYGLWDLTIAEVSNSLTEIVVTVKTDYNIPVTGLVLADFYLYNDTDSGEVVPSGVVETTATPGEYTLTIAAQDASDAYTLRVDKDTYDYNDTVSGVLTA